MYIENSSSSSPLIYGEFNNDLVSFNGSLGIGSTEFDDAQLVVDGKILAKKIYITTDDFPDYVFSDNYPLLSLADLESYITANKHLPGIRTRDEVISDGVPLGELSIQLLEKIEELTLHIIRLNTKTDQIKNQNIQIQQEIEVIRGIDSNN